MDKNKLKHTEYKNNTMDKNKLKHTKYKTIQSTKTIQWTKIN